MPVYLVGAGPGDPRLITVRGAELLGRADVVVYDRLSAADLLDLAPNGAELVDVGKAPGAPGPTQDEINGLLVAHGRSGRTVVRLKGGDPFVFARGGEELAAVRAAGVPVEVVPGISSAIGAPAYAGIPVTLRYSSTAFTVITGHEDPSKSDEIDWGAVARLGGTIVLLMAVGRIRSIADALVAGGLPPDTPVAAVRWGTRPDQQTVRATLGTIADQPLKTPATIVVGRVAALELPWFEQLPLFGRRVVVTRTSEQAGPVVARLRELGAEPVVAPVIAIEAPSDGGESLREAMGRVGGYDWLVVTSPNGAERALAELRDARALGGVKVAAIGPGTAAALASRNVAADLVPDRYIAEALVEQLPAPTAADRGRVLLARAEVARDVLPRGLAAKGWTVDVVPAYRTVPAPPDDALVDRVVGADAVLFTSSSTVERFVERYGASRVPPAVICIGPVTADTARRLGLDVTAVADEHTVDGLVAELVGALGDAPG